MWPHHSEVPSAIVFTLQPPLLSGVLAGPAGTPEFKPAMTLRSEKNRTAPIYVYERNVRSPGVNEIMTNLVGAFPGCGPQAFRDPPARIRRVDDRIYLQVRGHVDGFPSVIRDGQ